MIANDALGSLLKKRRTYIRDWLANGIVRYYLEDDPDGFYPHSFVSLEGDPLFTLIQSYRLSPPPGQSLLRDAIAGVSALALPKAVWVPVSLLNDANRLRLLSLVTSLVSETACTGAVPRLTDAVTSQLEMWTAEARTTAFAAVLRCITDLALSSLNHTSFDRKERIVLESCLVRLLHSEQFSPAYAPRCAHALVTIDPESYVQNHRQLLGEQITLLHKMDKEEESHAHATAEIIAERAVLQLMKYAPTMKIEGSQACDSWLLRAWDSKKSKFALFRKGGDSNQLFLARRAGGMSKGTRRMPIVLKNPAFHSFQLRGDISSIVGKKYVKTETFTRAMDGMTSVLRQIPSD